MSKEAVNLKKSVDRGVPMHMSAVDMAWPLKKNIRGRSYFANALKKVR
jgi:hypothetical protein